MKNTSHRKITSHAALKQSSKPPINSLNSTVTQTISPDIKINSLRSPIIKNPKKGKSYISTTVYVNSMDTSNNNTLCTNNSNLAKGTEAKEKNTKFARKLSHFLKNDLEPNSDKVNWKNYSKQNNNTNRTSSACNVIKISKKARNNRLQILPPKKLVLAKHGSPPQSSNASGTKNSRYNSNSYSSRFRGNFVASTEYRNDEGLYFNEAVDRNITMSSYTNKISDNDTSEERKNLIFETSRKGKVLKKVSVNLTNPKLCPGSFHFKCIDTEKFIQMFEKIKCVISDSIKPELENLLSILQDKYGNSPCLISNEQKNKNKSDHVLNKLIFEIDTLENEINAMNKCYPIESRPSVFLTKNSSSLIVPPKRFVDVESTNIYSDILKVFSERKMSIYREYFEICYGTIKEIIEKVKLSDLSTMSNISNCHTEIINANISTTIVTPVNKNSSVTFNTIITDVNEKAQISLIKKISKKKKIKSRKILSQGGLSYEENEDAERCPVNEGVLANIPISRNINVNIPKEANMLFKVFTDEDAESCEENQNNKNWILGTIDSFDEESEKEKEDSYKKKTFQRMRSKSLLEIKIKKNSLKFQTKPLDIENIISDSEEDGEGKNKILYNECVCTDDHNNTNSPGILPLHVIPVESTNVSMERESGFPVSPKSIIVIKPLKEAAAPSGISKEQHCIIY